MGEVANFEPDRLALQVAKNVSPNSTGKDVLKRYRELVAQKSSEKVHVVNESKSLSHGNLRSDNFHLGQVMTNLSFDLKSEVIEGDCNIDTSKRSSNFSIYYDPECNKAKDHKQTLRKKGGTAISSALKTKSCNIMKPRNLSLDVSPNMKRLLTDTTTSIMPGPHGDKSEKTEVKNAITSIAYKPEDSNVLSSNISVKDCTTTKSSVKNRQNPNEKLTSLNDESRDGSTTRKGNVESKTADDIESICSNTSYTISVKGRSYSLNLSSPLESIFYPRFESSDRRELRHSEIGKRSPNVEETLIIDHSSCDDLDSMMTSSHASGPVSETRVQSPALATDGDMNVSITHTHVFDGVEGLSVSPLTKAYAAALSSQLSTTSPNCGNKLSNAAISLIERNKTLYNEVRFAEQTCVEMAERHSATQRELLQRETENRSLKDEVTCLRGHIMNLTAAQAKLEEGRNFLTAQLTEKDKLHHQQVMMLEEQLNECRNQNLQRERGYSQREGTHSLLQQEVKSLQNKVMSMAEAQAKLEEERNLLRVQMTEKDIIHQHTVTLLEENINEVRNRHSEMEREHLHCDAERESLREEVKSLNDRIFQLSMEKSKLDEGLDLFNSRITDKDKILQQTVKMLEENRSQLESEINALREEGKRLQNIITQMAVEQTKLEEGRKLLISKMAENDLQHKREVDMLKEKSDEFRTLGESFMERLEDSNRIKAILEAKLVASQASYETLKSECSFANFSQTAANQTETIFKRHENTPSLNEMEPDEWRKKFEELHQRFEAKCLELAAIKEENRKYVELHYCCSSSSPSRSPTSRVLAKTLQQELERSQLHMLRLLDLERTNASTQSDLIAARNDLAQSQLETNKLQNRITELTTGTPYQTSSIYKEGGDVDDNRYIESTSSTSLIRMYSSDEDLETGFRSNSCQRCKSICDERNDAIHRFHSLHDDFKRLREKYVKFEESVRECVQVFVQSILSQTDLLHNQCQQKLEVYYRKIQTLTEAIIAFQANCTFIAYDSDVNLSQVFVDEMAVGTPDFPSIVGNDIYDDQSVNHAKESLRTKLASLRTQLESVQDSFGVDEIDSDFPADGVLQALCESQCSRDNNIGELERDNAFCDDGWRGKEVQREESGNVTVVVNVYTKSKSGI